MLERESPRALPITNGYAGDIPANSVVIASSATRRVTTVTRPTAANAAAVLITGFQVTKQSARGHASMGWPLWVKYNGTLAAGGLLGTAANSFEMTGGNKGFFALAVDSTNHLALIAPVPGGSDKDPAGGNAFHDGMGVMYIASDFTFDGQYQVWDLSAVAPGATAIQLCVYPSGSLMEFRNHYVMPAAEYPSVANDGSYSNLLVPATAGVIEYRGLVGMSSVDCRLIGYFA